MTNNDILKRLRYTFDFTDADMVKIFESADYEVPINIVRDWLRNEDDEQYKDINDEELAIFLNGFINNRRGKKDGPQPKAEQSLSNNVILRKLKIALNLQSDDIIQLLASEGKKVSKHEVSAFFRNPNHSKYKNLNDQYLRNFLQGLQKKFRP